MDKEMVMIIMKLVLAVMSVVITSYVIPWFKQSANAKKLNEVMEFCQKCVEAAEKKYTQEEWKEKKEYVLNLVANYIEKLGLRFTVDELDALIEGFVKEVKG